MQEKILECLMEVIKHLFEMEVNENQTFSGDLNLDELDLVEVVLAVEMNLDVRFEIDEIESDLYYGTLYELSEFLADHMI